MTLFLLLISISSALAVDFSSYHLHNHLNHSVNPCANFFRHVCFAEMPENSTIKKKSEIFYQILAEKLKSRSLNNPVMNDISDARKNLDCTFDSNECGSDFDCYFKEFTYFHNLYRIMMGYEPTDTSLDFFATHGNKPSPRFWMKSNETRIAETLQATSRMVELLYDVPDVAEEFEARVALYTHMQDRLYVMELLSGYNIGLNLIQNLSKQLKGVLWRQFNNTPWMRETSWFGLDIITQLMTILNELTVLTDFDAFDRNLTTLRRINRETTVKYFDYNKRCTGCSWFDMIHAFRTIAHQEISHYATHIFHASDGFEHGAWNCMDGNILVLATTFYPLIVNATEASTMAFAGTVIGHEMYHSFITEALLGRNEAFRNEVDCLSQHYRWSCEQFAEGFDYPDLSITRAQNFFYSAAMSWCGPIGSHDVHSPENIRVNGPVSQMPEFSEAFGCQPGDPLYSEPDTVCYLFGEKSTGEKVVVDVVQDVTESVKGNDVDSFTASDVVDDATEPPHVEENSIDVVEAREAGRVSEEATEPSALQENGTDAAGGNTESSVVEDANLDDAEGPIGSEIAGANTEILVLNQVNFDDMEVEETDVAEEITQSPVLEDYEEESGSVGEANEDGEPFIYDEETSPTDYQLM